MYVPLGLFQLFVLRQIREEIEQYGIKIYQFPDCDSDEDEDFKQQDQELKVQACFSHIVSWASEREREHVCVFCELFSSSVSPFN